VIYLKTTCLNRFSSIASKEGNRFSDCLTAVLQRVRYRASDGLIMPNLKRLGSKLQYLTADTEKEEKISIQRVQTTLQNTQNGRVSGLCKSFEILKNYKTQRFGNWICLRLQVLGACTVIAVSTF
jgi:hypothetical protein